MANKGTKKEAGTAPQRKGRKLGGDDAPTYAFADGEIVGKVKSLDMVATRYNPRCRVVIELAQDAELHVTRGKSKVPEEADLSAGDEVGLWLPGRWSETLKPLVGKPVSFDKEGQGLSTVYHVYDQS